MTDNPDILTADSVTLHSGDRAYNHYDMKPGTISRTRHFPQPNLRKGQDSSTPIADWDDYWFTFDHDDGTSCSLNGDRICTIAFAQSRGWPGA